MSSSDRDDVRMYEGAEIATHVRVVRYLTVNYDVTSAQAEQLATKHDVRVSLGNLLSCYASLVGDQIAAEEHLTERL